MKLFGKSKSAAKEQELQVISSTSSVSADNKLHLGPRNRQPASEQLEVFLTQLAKTAPNKIDFQRVTGGDWTVSLADAEAVNLSVLLRHADLDHIRLSQVTIIGLGALFPNLSHYHVKKEANGTAFAELPDVQVAAIRFYTGNEYKTINAFFRGYDKDSASLRPLDCLVVGVLVNQAMLEIPFILSHHPEYPNVNDATLYRKEIFSQDEKVRHRQGVVSAGHALSTSITNAGRNDLIVENTGWGASVHPISMVPSENERILGNEKLQCVTMADGNTKATIVNSPDFDKSSRLLSAQAFSDVYQQFLSKRYRDSADTITINGVAIERPYHGLALVTQQLLTLSAVIEFFVQHAREVQIAQTLRTLSSNDLEFLRLLIVFNISGREAEYSYRDNPKQYTAYRLASANNFAEYATKNNSCSENQIVLGHELLLTRGIPDARLKEHPFWIILSFIHDLALIRCMSDHEYQNTLQRYQAHCDQDPQAENDWQSLQNFVVTCLVAMGDQCFAASNIQSRAAPFHVFASNLYVADTLVSYAPVGIPSVDDCKRIRSIIASLADFKATAQAAVALGEQSDVFKIIKNQFGSEDYFLKSVGLNQISNDIMEKYLYESKLSTETWKHFQPSNKFQPELKILDLMIKEPLNIKELMIPLTPPLDISSFLNEPLKFNHQEKELDSIIYKNKDWDKILNKSIQQSYPDKEILHYLIKAQKKRPLFPAAPAVQDNNDDDDDNDLHEGKKPKAIEASHVSTLSK